MKRYLLNLMQYIQSFMHKSWYPYLISCTAALDVFLLIFPNDLFLVSAAMSQKKRWLFIAVLVSVGSTFGGAVLAVFAYADPESMMSYFPSIFESEVWEQASGFIYSYGAPIMFLAGAGPIPFQAFIFAAAFANIPIVLCIAFLFLGRLAKYLLFAWAASHAPHLLQKLALTKKEKVKSI